jgi:hypothetical protein
MEKKSLAEMKKDKQMSFFPLFIIFILSYHQHIKVSEKEA